MSNTQDLLVVIDMQEIFQRPGGQWGVPNYEQITPQVQALADAFAQRTVWTRFVRDPQEHGSWGPYYQRWDECRLDPQDPAWEITLPTSPEDPVIDRPTFSKWGEELAALVEGYRGFVVCGVTTDCCVLSTVLGAVDAGVQVTVVTDACAGLTEESHRDTLRVLELLEPMVRLTTVADLLDSEASELH